MSKLTLTIGIPAHNERHNLEYLLPALLSQTRKNYHLTKIVVVSDGSSDKTIKLASLYGPRVQIIEDGQRLGKPARVNQMFAFCRTQAVAIVDADLKLAHDSVIDALVAPLCARPKADFTSGHAVPLPPRSLVQKIAAAGIDIWEFAIAAAPSDMYRCEGQIRAFGKRMYSRLRFPDLCADDVYPYLWGHTRGFRFVSSPKAQVGYRLPAALSDYVSQQRRYVGAPGILLRYFSARTISRCFVIQAPDRLRAIAKSLVTNPFYTVAYVMVTFFIRLQLRAVPVDSTSRWKMAVTTKQ